MGEQAWARRGRETDRQREGAGGRGTERDGEGGDAVVIPHEKNE